eukprot:6176385-Pleurochrysis_carterae.AAC.2
MQNGTSWYLCGVLLGGSPQPFPQFSRLRCTCVANEHQPAQGWQLHQAAGWTEQAAAAARRGLERTARQPNFLLLWTYGSS